MLHRKSAGRLEDFISFQVNLIADMKAGIMEIFAGLHVPPVQVS